MFLNFKKAKNQILKKNQNLMICNNYARVISIFSVRTILNSRIIKQIMNNWSQILMSMKLKMETTNKKFMTEKLISKIKLIQFIFNMT